MDIQKKKLIMNAIANCFSDEKDIVTKEIEQRMNEKYEQFIASIGDMADEAFFRKKLEENSDSSMYLNEKVRLASKRTVERLSSMYPLWKIPQPAGGKRFRYLHGDFPWNFTIICYQKKYFRILRKFLNCVITLGVAKPFSKDETPSVAEIVLCGEYEEVYRAYFIEVVDDLRWKLYDIDNDITTSESPARVYRIKQSLISAPPLAIRCTLTNGSSGRSSWAHSMTTAFHTFMREFEFSYSVKDFNITEYPPRYHIHLIGQAKFGPKIDINRWFFEVLSPFMKINPNVSEVDIDEINPIRWWETNSQASDETLLNQVCQSIDENLYKQKFDVFKLLENHPDLQDITSKKLDKSVISPHVKKDAVNKKIQEEKQIRQSVGLENKVNIVEQSKENLVARLKNVQRKEDEKDIEDKDAAANDDEDNPILPDKDFIFINGPPVFNQEVDTCRFYLENGHCWKPNCEKEHVGPVGKSYVGSVYTYSHCSKPLVLPRDHEIVNIFPVHVVDGHAFYAQLKGRDKPFELTLTMVQDRLRNYAEITRFQWPSESLLPSVGELLIAESRRGYWFRGRVVGLHETGPLMFDIDNGEEEIIPFDKLRLMNYDLLFLPPQAVRCRLYKIYPIRSKREQAMTFLHQLISRKEYSALVKISDQEKSELEIILYLKDGTNLNDLMINNGLCTTCQF